MFTAVLLSGFSCCGLFGWMCERCPELDWHL